ncbi:MAG: carbonic anhydrase [Verrucomicrobiota bacterium]
MTTLHKLPLLLATGFLSLGSLASAADHAAFTPVSADSALKKLVAGNARFAKNDVTSGKPVAAKRAETAQTQHPFAIVVGCADSRTSPELVFDQNIGDLFVVRTAGNLVDDYALGSIEYAVAHLGSRLIVVLGHERCGAVKAAVASGSAPGHVGSIVSEIRPAVKATKDMAGDALVNAIQENVNRVAKKIAKESKLGEAAPEVKVVKAYYDLDSGKVSWLE